MNESSDDDLEPILTKVAQWAIQQYARGILPVEALAAKMLEEWKALRVSEDKPSEKLLKRIAQRICSQALFEAWRSTEIDARNCAYDNLRRYLEDSLKRSRYARSLRLLGIDFEDVLHQTLAELHFILADSPCAGPNDPATFLRWTMTILIRQAYAFVDKSKRQISISVDEQPELELEQLTNKEIDDPEEQASLKELHEVLKNAILSLSNLHYREVLLGTYFAELDDCELAFLLQVKVEKIYLWRHRALQALRSKPEVMKALRPWLR